MALTVIIEKREGDICIVKIGGHLDTETYTEMSDKLKPVLESAPKALVLDMSNLEYVSSAGLSVIFNAKKTLESKNGTLIMSNLQPQIKKVFEIVKVMSEQSIFQSVEEVDAYLDAMQKKVKEEGTESL